MTIPTITTSRLVLRAFTKEDIDPLHHILCARDILRYFPNPSPPARDRVERLISDRLKHWEEHGFGWWAVEPRSKKQLIGWSGLLFLPETRGSRSRLSIGPSLLGEGVSN